MNNERWVTAAIVTDALVADLLLHLKQSSPPVTTTTSLHPIGWGDRKSRSKASNSKGQLQRSPSSPLSWSGGAGTSTSDGYDEFSRPSEIYSGLRSDKGYCSTISIDNKSRKRKIDLHQNHEKKDGQFVKTLCKFKSEIEIQKRQFVLPDLNETPIYEELVEL